jgi:hypothetical protein
MCNLSVHQSSVTVWMHCNTEDDRLWPKHVMLLLNGECCNDCRIIDELNT